MICPYCYGKDMKCTECHGQGIIHCCEGLIASELEEQIICLAKEPPVATFDTHEELMDWLDKND